MTRSITPSTLGCLILATAACGSSLDRIGFVEAVQTQTFTFKWPISDLRFLTRFLAQGCLLTESLPVYAGDDLLLIVRVIDNQQASQVRCR